MTPLKTLRVFVIMPGTVLLVALVVNQLLQFCIKNMAEINSFSTFAMNSSCYTVSDVLDI